ncbi:choice-of-anchor tandem repeat GloVer-containing protein [Algibacter mikhailovii]|uniref:BIG2 domain-containing protein n=1 Tax=Algibacter mikhailovii TaxID=425498 RepID=A0A918REH8_9FLAO|nr:choice-of-anchor tandem repeat GloVer-containing protein [Algibacter mikhailovii]GGZ94408.1 hypothetical protein GCM10007028_35940 [Algibacter mikhailovii]
MKIIVFISTLFFYNVLLAQHSAIWGTAFRGGANDAGFIYKLDPDGSNYEIVHEFNGTTTGRSLYAGLVKGNDGLLYGVTAFGGASDAGVLYSINPENNDFEVLHHFEVGMHPQGELVLAANGNFYGYGNSGSGVIFEFNPSNRSMEIVHSFSDSAFVSAEGYLIEVESNVLYGIGNSLGNYGRIFKLDMNTGIYSELHSFSGTIGRCNPTLLLTDDNVLYGTSLSEEIIFTFDLKTNTLEIVATLSGDFSGLNGGLIMASSGKIYGTAVFGGPLRFGSLFEFDPVTKTTTNVYTCRSETDGVLTNSPTEGYDGNIYSTTRYGGTGDGLGKIFMYNPSTGSSTETLVSLDDAHTVASILLVVGERTITDLTLFPKDSTITTDDGQITFRPEILPTLAMEQDLLWTSSDPSIATISSDGVLTAQKNGVVTISATANYGLGISDETTVTVTNQDGNIPEILTETITITSETNVINSIGQTLQLGTDFSPSNVTNQNVTWSISDESIAEISSDGIITALNTGQVTVTALSSDGTGIIATKVVLINSKITSIDVNSAADIIDTEDGTLQMLAIVTPSNSSNTDVYWNVSDESIATISEDGLLQALLDGTVTVYAEAYDGSGVIGSKEITITNQIPYVEIESIIINAESDMITTCKGTLQLTATILPENATVQNLEWTTTNSGVATIDQNGLITAVSNGTVYIAATPTEGTNFLSGIFVVTISNQTVIAVESFHVSTNSSNILINESDSAFIQNIYPANATCYSINWTVEDSDVLELTQENDSVIFDGKSVGNTTIKVTIENGDNSILEKEISVNVGSTLAVAEETQSIHGITLYPNPSSGTFSINGITENVSVDIISISGQIIKSFFITPTNSELDICELSTGTYLIRILNKSGIFFRKIILL